MGTVINPSLDETVAVDPATGREFQGNKRIFELQRRAADPKNAIPWENEYPV
jgi:hypothetical protein